jgi:hypothetical protein
MAESFTVVKRNAFSSGRERVSNFLVLEDVVGTWAQGVVEVNVRRERTTSDRHFRLCVLCVGRRTDFEAPPINPPFAVLGHLSEILLRSLRPTLQRLALFGP